MVDIYAFLRGKVEEFDKFVEGKPADVEKQTLKEHVDQSLKAINDVKGSKIWKYTVKLFNGNEDFVEEVLKLIITFHDIGKLFYQANTSKEKDVKYLNFKGHEYFSTYLTDEYLKDYDNKSLVLSAILYHHHAMGLRERLKVKELRVCRSEREYDVMCEILCEIIKTQGLKVNGFLSYLKSLKDLFEEENNVLILKQRVINDIYREVSEINRKIFHLFIRDVRFKKGMLVFVVILQICDYRGSKARTKKPPKFYGILKEFIKLYKMKNKNKYMNL